MISHMLDPTYPCQLIGVPFATPHFRPPFEELVPAPTGANAVPGMSGGIFVHEPPAAALLGEDPRSHGADDPQVVHPVVDGIGGHCPTLDGPVCNLQFGAYVTRSVNDCDLSPASFVAVMESL